MQAFFERLLETHGKSFAVAFGLGLLITLMILPSTVGAQPATAEERAQEVQRRAEERAERVNERAERAVNREAEKVERQELRETRLTEKKLEICERRQTKIQNLMSRIADRGEKHLDVFTKISDRTQAFYEEKGLSVENYDELVANVEEKKLAAQDHVTTVRDRSSEFVCDGENPTGVAGAFKDDLKLQIAALKDYRTAVKDLIVGIRTVAEAEEAESAETDESEATDETGEATRTEDETTEEGAN